MNKTEKMLIGIACLGTLIVLALPLSIFASPDIQRIDHYYNCSLTAYGSPGSTCVYGPYTADTIIPILTSTSPSGATICVGYTANGNGGPIYCNNVVGSGSGLQATDGLAHKCADINQASVSEQINADCQTYIS